MRVIFLIFIFVHISFITFADDKNPFKDGIEKVALTKNEVEELKAYVINSKYILEEAVSKAKDKNFSEKKEIFNEAIREVVLYSYYNKGFDELLMRIILNQALELTTGLPYSNGSGISKEGLLNNNISDDLLVVIIKDHIDLALIYTDNDLNFLESNNYMELPFNEVALKRLELSLKWGPGIFNVQMQNQVYQLLLSHFLSTVLKPENLKNREISEILLKVQDLKNLEHLDIYRKNRMFKAFFRKLPVLIKNNAHRLKTSQYDAIQDRYKCTGGVCNFDLDMCKADAKRLDKINYGDMLRHSCLFELRDNLNTSLNQCLAFANTTIDEKEIRDDVKFYCVKFLKSKISYNQCVKVANTMHDGDGTRYFCYNTFKYQIDFNECSALANNMQQKVEFGDSMRFTCFNDFKHTMTFNQCLSLSNNMKRSHYIEGSIMYYKCYDYFRFDKISLTKRQCYSLIGSLKKNRKKVYVRPSDCNSLP